MDWLSLVIGVVAGCLILWLLDWFLFRRRRLAAETLLKEQLEACNQETASLKAQLASLQEGQPAQTRSVGVDIPLEQGAEPAVTAEQQTRLDTADAEIKELTATIEGLKTEAASAKDLKVRLDHANAELSKLRAQTFAMERLQKDLDACQAEKADQLQEIVRLTAALASGPAAAAAAAEEAAVRGAGAETALAAPAEPDDLTIIEGIGPKISELLNASGIRTFAQLAAASPGRLQGILEAGGRRFGLADPGTWPQQAALARDGKRDDFEALVAGLQGGRRV